jgi:DNA topoisomerase-1
MMECDKYYNEASLIQKLETLGIGRPSTFSMLTETIQERKYVLRQDIEGKEFVGNEYVLTGKEHVVKKEVKKVFGASKNKLVIQELGMQVIRKLQEFEALFEYSYTSKMEKELDDIIGNHELWKSVCANCDEMISSCLTPLQLKIKKKYVIDESHTIVFGKFGVVVQYQVDGKGDKSYKSIKKNVELDFQKMENHEYSLEDILEITNDCLGKFENENVFLRTGQYGPYVTFGDNKTMSIKPLITKARPIEKITMAEVETFLKMKTSSASSSSADKNSSVLRVISETASVRKGKFGNYIYYKTADMKKPEFISLANCPFDVLEVEVADAEKVSKWISVQRIK